MRRPTADQLQALPLFAQVTKRDRELFARGLEVVDVAPGSTVVHAGHPNHGFYLVVAGELDVAVDQQHRHTLRPGAFFGEISLERGTPATATVVARTPATLYRLDEAAYRTLRQNTEAVLRIRGAMTNREAADRLFGHVTSSTARPGSD